MKGLDAPAKPIFPVLEACAGKLPTPRRAKPERRGSKPDMLEAKLISIVVEQAHRRARRSPALGGAARIEDLKAILCFEQRQVAVAEDDGSGFGKALAEAL